MQVQFLINDVAYILTCPVESTLLIDGVSLPCGDNISLVAAKRLFGDPETGWKTNLCPTCEVSVSSYVADENIRKIAKIYEALQKIAIEMIKNRKEPIEIPYPGKPAELVLESDKFYEDPSSPLSRFINFKSHTNDSLLKSFSLLVYRDDSIGIMMLSSNIEKIKKYLKKLDLKMNLIEEEQYKNCFLVDFTVKNQAQRLFDTIIKNNKLPENDQKTINDIILKSNTSNSDDDD